jgi:hypothetical protein
MTAISSCILSIGSGLGRCCHAIAHPTFQERPGAVYGVLVQGEDERLIEHALCAECTARTRETAADGEVLGVKMIARFAP